MSVREPKQALNFDVEDYAFRKAKFTTIALRVSPQDDALEIYARRAGISHYLTGPDRNFVDFRILSDISLELVQEYEASGIYLYMSICDISELLR